MPLFKAIPGYETGKPNISRTDIKMSDESIADPHGTTSGENANSFMDSIAEKELKKKKEENRRRLFSILCKTTDEQPVSRDDLIFLYEINEPIGYLDNQKYSIVRKILHERNIQEDALIVFECQPNQMAYKIEDVNEDTKAYIGEWNIEVFRTIRKYPNIRYLYESFPNEKIIMQTLKTDPKINSPESVKEAFRVKKSVFLIGKRMCYAKQNSVKKKKRMT